jgi:adenylate cyclase
VLGLLGEDLASALELVDHALQLNPNFARGWLRLWAGQPDLAIEHFERFSRLSPHDIRAAASIGIGTGHFLLADWKKPKR